MKNKLSIFALFMLVFVLLIPACAPAAKYGANNIVYEPATSISVATTSPVQPSSGDAVRYGYLTGVALTDYSSTDNTSTVDFGTFIAKLPVTASGAVSAGDALYFIDGTGVTNLSTNGYYFGVAMAAVSSGTKTISVYHTQSPGAMTLGTGTIGSTDLASSSVIEAKIGTGAVTATKLGALAVETAAINTAAVTLGKISPNSIDGTITKNVATGDAIGGIPNVHMITIPTGATGNIDTTITDTELVTDVWIVKDSVSADSAANSIQLVNGTGSNYLTDAISENGTAASAIVRAGYIYQTYAKIAAGATLRVVRTRAASGDVGCTVYVETVRVAP